MVRRCGAKAKRGERQEDGCGQGYGVRVGQANIGGLDGTATDATPRVIRAGSLILGRVLAGRVRLTAVRTFDQLRTFAEEGAGRD